MSHEAQPWRSAGHEGMPLRLPSSSYDGQLTLDLKKRAGFGACSAARRATGMTPDGLAWLIGSMEEVFIAPGDRGPAKHIQTTLLHIGARWCCREAGTHA